MDYAALKQAITADPALAKLSESGRDADIAAELNKARADIKLFRGIVPAHEIVAAITPEDWAALTAAEKQRIQLIVSAGQVDLSAANVRSALSTAFGSGTTTRQNIIALATRDGSRAEQITGVSVTPADIAVALRG